jgi:hypothetical protein
MSLESFSWLVPIIITNLVNIFKDGLNERTKEFFGKVNLFESLGRYRDRILKDYSYITLFGIGKSAYFDNDFLVDTYFLNESQVINYSFHKTTDIISKSNLQKIDLNFINQNNNNHYYILGDPGTGKSTFLKYLAYSASIGKIQKLPIFVSLNTFANSKKELLDFLVEEFDICDLPDAQPIIEYLLQNGQTIVLFDGLDEVKEFSPSGKSRNEVIAEISSFCRKYEHANGNLIFVTCRNAANEYRFEKFDYLIIAEFNNETIAEYARKWFQTVTNENSNQFIKELFDKKNTKILDLARNPLLLSLLCFVYLRTSKFPEKKIELYEEAILALLKTWDNNKGVVRDVMYKGLNVESKMAMFAQIAYDNVRNNSKFIHFSRREAENSIADFLSRVLNEEKKLIPANDILQAVVAQHGILKINPDLTYSFAHLSFQEYFSALYYLDNFSELITEKRIVDDQWREVILNVASFLSKYNAADFFNLFFEANFKMIADNPKLIKFLEWANEKAQRTKTSRRICALRFFYCYLVLLEANRFSKEEVHVRAILVEKDFTLAQNFGRSFITEVDEELAHLLNLIIANNFNPSINIFDDFHLEKELSIDYTLFYFSQVLNNYYLPNLIQQNKNAIAKILEFWLNIVSTTSHLCPPELKQDITNFSLTKNDFELNEDYSDKERKEKYEILEKKHKQLKRLIYSTLKCRGINFNWQLNIEEVKRLSAYFYANQVLFSAVNSASNFNQNKLEDNILLPTTFPYE